MFARMKARASAKKGSVCAIIPAAGSSARMGGENKLLMELCDMPVLVHTVLAFARCDAVDDIVICCREQDILCYGKLMQEYGLNKVRSIVRGGETRTASVLAGIRACPQETVLLAVHDGARPLVTQEIITQAIESAWAHGAAAPIVPPKDSIKRVESGLICADVPRAEIAAVQTPQVFRREILTRALETAEQDNHIYTDDCAAVEALHVDIYATEGSYENIKITTPEDILIGEAILNRRENEL